MDQSQGQNVSSAPDARGLPIFLVLLSHEPTLALPARYCKPHNRSETSSRARATRMAHPWDVILPYRRIFVEQFRYGKSFLCLYSLSVLTGYAPAFVLSKRSDVVHSSHEAALPRT